MEDQGKRLLVAVALAMVVLLGWQLFFSPKEKPKAKQPTPTATTTQQVAQATTHVGETPDGKTSPAAQRGPDQRIELKFPKIEATFSSHGGVLSSWHLTERRYDKDKTKGELLPSAPDSGAFAVNFASSTYVLPPNAEWMGTKVSDTQVKYTISTDNLDVEKTFDVVPSLYLVKLTIKATTKGTGEARQTLALTTFGFQDVKDSGGGGRSVEPRVWHSATLHDELKQTAVKEVQKQARYEAGFQWTGFEHPFLLVAVAPRPAPDTTLEKTTYGVGSDGLMRTDILFKPGSVMKPGAPLVREVVAYLGPKELSALQSADSAAGFSTGFNKSIDLGMLWFIGGPLRWLLLKFFSFLHNWGLAIVLLTILVKGLTIPFTTKSMRSMKAMAVLAPEMKALQEKYKDDKQRLQMETMNLYKQHGANPLSGCLPILLQMPIWLGLYRMLSNTGELYQQTFITGWIDDLTNADPLHILPIVLCITMFLQARLQPASPDPSQKMQQRMMQYGLPLMFGVMSFFFPAGLTLYIFTNTILSALHSIYMNKFDKKSIELAEKIKQAQEAKLQQTNKVAASKAKNANVQADDDDDNDEADDEPAASANKIVPRNRPNRPKRKKRRR